MSFPTAPSKKFQLALSLLVLGGFVTYLLYIFRDIWRPKIEENDRFIDSSIAINANIEQQENAFPAHVQSGFVEIGNRVDLSTYRFGPQGDPSKFLESQGFVARGIYVKSSNYWKRVDSLEELNNGDTIVITYYQSPGYSDSGKQGKTILGIADYAERQRNNIKISFVDDPSGKIYQFSKSVPLRTEDQLGTFDFGEVVFDGIGRGSTLRVLINDEDIAMVATVLAPRTDVVDGKLKKIRITPVENEYEIFIEGYDEPFFATGKTSVVERAKPSQLLKVPDIPKESFITILYYNGISRYEILSLDFMP